MNEYRNYFKNLNSELQRLHYEKIFCEEMIEKEENENLKTHWLNMIEAIEGDSEIIKEQIEMALLQEQLGLSGGVKLWS